MKNEDEREWVNGFVFGVGAGVILMIVAVITLKEMFG